MIYRRLKLSRIFTLFIRFFLIATSIVLLILLGTLLIFLVLVDGIVTFLRTVVKFVAADAPVQLVRVHLFVKVAAGRCAVVVGRVVDGV